MKTNINIFNELNESFEKEIEAKRKLTEGTDYKRIARYNEFDNGHVLHNDWQDISDEEAEELAKQASIEDPTDVYYVQFDDIMNSSNDNRWYKGELYTVNEIRDKLRKEKEALWKKAQQEKDSETTSNLEEADNYQLRKYPNEEDFKGTWGIYDLKNNKFIQKGSKKIMSAGLKELSKKSEIKEADLNTYKDEDEAAYYRNKELYSNSGLERHKEAMEKAKKACEDKGIKLYKDHNKKYEKEHKMNENDDRNYVLILGLNKDINNRELVYVTDTDNKADVNELRGNKVDGYKILGAYFEEGYDGDAKQYVNEFKNDNDFKFVYKPLSYIKSNLQKSNKMNEDFIHLTPTKLSGEPINFVKYNEDITDVQDLVGKYVNIKGNYHAILKVEPTEDGKYIIDFAASTDANNPGGEFEPATLEEINNLQLYIEEKKECDNTIKEDETVIIPDTEIEPDYIINDVTVLDSVGDGDVQAPDIDALLTLVNESLVKDYGNDWGHINVLSSRIDENSSFALVDITTKEILREFEEKGIKDVAVGKSLILENAKSGLVEFKVNSLNGVTRFSKKTNDPAKIIKEWIETEYLHESMLEKEAELLQERTKAEKDAVENYIKSRPDLMQAIENINMFIEVSKAIKAKDEMKPAIQDRMYGLAVEFPANIQVTNKDDKYELTFDGRDQIVEIVFGKEWVKEPTEDNKVPEMVTPEQGLQEAETNPEADALIKDYYNYKMDLPTLHDKLEKVFGNKKDAVEYFAANDNRIKNLKESEELPNIEDVVYDLDKDKAWSVTDYTEDGNNNKIIIVKKYGNSKSSASDIKKAVESKYPQLKGYVTENKNGVWFYLNDMKSSLTESYQQFNIGEIEVVFNPDTYECLYSIPSADVKDKKVNLSDVPTVDTPYDTNTIIKSYVETKFGRIPTEEPEEDKVEVNKEVTAAAPDGDSVSVDTTTEVPAEEDIPVEEAELPDEPGEEPTDDVDVNVDLDTPAEETQEDQAETGSATFVKVRPKQHTSVEDIRTNIVDGDTPQSNYIVVDEINLSEEDWNNLISDLSTPQAFLEGIKSIDRKNYSFNVVKVTSPAANYTLLIDPLGYSYPRYVAVVD